jgi:hypothetical protein
MKVLNSYDGFYAGGWLTAAGILSYIHVYICNESGVMDSILHAERNMP